MLRLGTLRWLAGCSRVDGASSDARGVCRTEAAAIRGGAVVDSHALAGVWGQTERVREGVNEHLQGGQSNSAGEQVSVLFIADPGTPAALAERIAEYLPQRLQSSDRPERRWTTCVRRKPYLPNEQADFADVIDTVDPSSEAEDIVVYLTDLPRREDTLPVVGEVSADHKFALISVAGVGGVNIERRVRTVTELAIARILGEPELKPPGGARRFPCVQIEDGIRYFAPAGLRRLRLLSGMVRVNRPWRLVTGLSKVLVGAFATGAIALATETIWLFADTMGPWRMSAATVLSIVAMILWLILDHELWERPKSQEERNRSVLYNTATVVTLVIGVVILHVALFGLLLFTTCLALPPELLSRILGRAVNFSDYLTLTWLLASIATIGGALGSGLEDDAAVKEAAYGVRQRQRLEETRQPSNEAR
ncbi:putative membrane protein [Rhodococcus opacus]|nr:putative membrane protein [Rhodococcus opacus]